MNGDPVPNHTSFTLVGDQNTKTRYENNFGGQRLATSVGGMLTGEGGDKIVVDDPHNVTEVESTVARKSTLSWWDESMSTRANDPMKSVYVIIMQRTHESDLTGHVLSREQGWDHLCLPAEFESNTKYYYDKNRRITDPFKTVSTLGFVDPRMEDGEPLWGKRWTKEAISQLKETLGAYASAGQLQQRPAPREGGMFNVDNFILMENYNMGHVEKYVRYWDKAGTQGGGAYTAGCLMAKLKKGCSPQYVVVDMVHGQWSSAIREQKIKQTADLDTRKVEVWVEQEPGSGGKESSENTIKMLAGFKAYAERVTGSKETRAEPYSSQVEIGNVGILIRPWTKNLLDEHQIFPNGKYKDQVDAAGGAFNKLAAVKKTGGVW
jgi:predicted phage terminase large subunit-like protein